MAAVPPPYDFDADRARMVRVHLERRGIRDAAVLRAMGTVPRHEFVHPSDWDEAYDDHPLGIDCRQTISQPYIVAAMTEALQVAPGTRVLEIGTGSGYQTAVLAEMGAVVFTVERFGELSEQAESVLRKLGYADGVTFRVGDGTLGWPEEAPFDRILVAATGPRVPQALREQLKPGGRMILPVGGNRHGQKLRLVQRYENAYKEKDIMDVVFVRLVGEDGYEE